MISVVLLTRYEPPNAAAAVVIFAVLIVYSLLMSWLRAKRRARMRPPTIRKPDNLS